MHHLALPAPGDAAALQELVGDLMTMPLDRNRPLWHTYMIDGFGDGAAMICRMHHCIADGIALAQVMLSLTDSEAHGRDRSGLRSAEAPPRQGGLLTRLVGSGSARWTLDGTGRVDGGAPGRRDRDGPPARRQAGRGGRARRSDRDTPALTPADAATAIKGDPGISRRVAWTKPLPLSQIKRIAHAQNATVNDVLLAAVSGALRHYLQDRGSPVAEIQAMVPFNLRPLDQPVPRELGNKFGLVFLPLPVGVSGSYRRLVEVHKRMTELKQLSRRGGVLRALERLRT